ncbi:MAG: putative baseplate assembly protein, partial [Cyclobacteriaceae bacterium]
WITTGRWVAKRDLLLDSQGNSQHFVAEVDENGECRIRFGDDINGKLPNAGAKFEGRFRTGNGTAGNVGAGAIRHMVTQQNILINSISNPLPAFGGKDPETLEEVKQYAPEAFRTQQRAVTREDYEYFAKLCGPDVQRATAAYRWTGSWHTAFVSADRLGDKPVDEQFERGLRGCLEKYRMAGMDLEVDAPIQIGLQIDMEVCIGQDYSQSGIRAALLRLFSNRVLGGGKKGIFHPDNFSFGQSVYLSTLYAAAQSVEGVTSVKVTGFKRLGNTELSGLKDGVLTFNRQEIPRLDNDPNFRDRGVFNLTIKGGR